MKQKFDYKNNIIFRIDIRYRKAKKFGIVGHHHDMPLSDIMDGCLLDVLNYYDKYSPEIVSVQVIERKTNGA